MKSGRLIAAALCIYTVALAQRYDVTELPYLPQLEAPWDSGIEALNDAGQVLAVGSSPQDAKFRSFIFIGSQWQEIIVSDMTIATGLNNLGQVTGSAITENPEGHGYPFIWSAHGFTLVPLPNHFVTAINDRGAIAGTMNGGDTFMWRGGIVRNIDLGSTDYRPLLNNRGELATMTSGAGHVTAWFVSRKGVRRIAPGGTDAWAYGMNNRGDVVGGFDNGSFIHAYLYSKGRMLDLQPSPDEAGMAMAINDRREIIGFWHQAGVDHTFLYRDGKRHELPDLVDSDGTWDFALPTAINHRGQIAGIGTHGGKTAGYILTPQKKRGPRVNLTASSPARGMSPAGMPK